MNFLNSIAIKDGSQANLDVLTSDANGLATWAAPTGGSSQWTNITGGIEYTGGKATITSTTTQMRLAYDASNYYEFRVISNGSMELYQGVNNRYIFSNGRILATEYGGSNLTTYSGANDTDTGLALWTGDKMSLMTGGSHRITIPSSGNVGIGMDPIYKLDVAGNINAQAGSIHATSTSTVAGAQWGLSLINYGNIGGSYSTSAGVFAESGNPNWFSKTDLVFKDNHSGDVTANPSTEVMRITGGKVGIGLVDPQAILNVFGTTEQLRLNYDASNYCAFTVNNTGALQINATGSNATIQLMDHTTATAGISTNGTASASNFYARGASASGNDTTTELNIGGGTGTNWRSIFNGTTASTVATGYSYSTVVVGASAVTEAGSGTHPIFASLAVKIPTVTTAAATVTNTATLYVEGAMTNGTNNYALWVDAGTARLDGALELQGIANATAADVLFYDSTTKTVTYGTAPAGGSGSGIVRSVNSISSPTTAGSAATTDYVYFVSGTTTLTLPTAVGNTNRYTIIHTDSNTMTIATTSSQTIAFYPAAPATTATVTVQGTVVELISNGSNWWTI